MSDQDKVEYNDGDVVWVKLGPCWWPGEVHDIHRVPPEIQPRLKKPPIAFVHFFQEDKYEYVRSYDHIYHYNCERKKEFIKKGLDMHRAKQKHMDKFPIDVCSAEHRTNGDPDIITSDEFTPEKKVNYSDLFGSNKKSSKRLSIDDGKPKRGRKPSAFRIIAQRLGNVNLDYEEHYLEENLVHLNHTPHNIFQCHMCDYSCSRLCVIELHLKSHYHDSSGRRKKGFKLKKWKMTRCATASLDEDLELLDKNVDLETYNPSNQKKLSPSKIKTPKLAKNPTGSKRKNKNSEKIVINIRENLLADWEDSDGDSNDNSKKQQSFWDDNKPELNNSVPNSNNLSKKDTTKTKSCFDFDEEEEEDATIVSKSIGRKIPRVIPENQKQKSFDIENIFDKSSTTPTNKPKRGKKAKAVEEVDKETLNSTFDLLMEETAIPDLPSLPSESQTVKINIDTESESALGSAIPGVDPDNSTDNSFSLKGRKRRQSSKINKEIKTTSEKVDTDNVSKPKDKTIEKVINEPDKTSKIKDTENIENKKAEDKEKIVIPETKPVESLRGRKRKTSPLKSLSDIESDDNSNKETKKRVNENISKIEKSPPPPPSLRVSKRKLSKDVSESALKLSRLEYTPKGKRRSIAHELDETKEKDKSNDSEVVKNDSVAEHKEQPEKLDTTLNESKIEELPLPVHAEPKRLRSPKPVNKKVTNEVKTAKTESETQNIVSTELTPSVTESNENLSPQIEEIHEKFIPKNKKILRMESAKLNISLRRGRNSKSEIEPENAKAEVVSTGTESTTVAALPESKVEELDNSKNTQEEIKIPQRRGRGSKIISVSPHKEIVTIEKPHSRRGRHLRKDISDPEISSNAEVVPSPIRKGKSSKNDTSAEVKAPTKESPEITADISETNLSTSKPSSTEDVKSPGRKSRIPKNETKDVEENQNLVVNEDLHTEKVASPVRKGRSSARKASEMSPPHSTDIEPEIKNKETPKKEVEKQEDVEKSPVRKGRFKKLEQTTLEQKKIESENKSKDESKDNKKDDSKDNKKEDQEPVEKTFGRKSRFKKLQQNIHEEKKEDKTQENAVPEKDVKASIKSNTELFKKTVVSVESNSDKSKKEIETTEKTPDRNEKVIETVESHADKKKKEIETVESSLEKNKKVLETIESNSNKNKKLIEPIKSGSDKNKKAIETAESISDKNKKAIVTVESDFNKNKNIPVTAEISSDKNKTITAIAEVSSDKNKKVIQPEEKTIPKKQNEIILKEKITVIENSAQLPKDILGSIESIDFDDLPKIKSKVIVSNIKTVESKINANESKIEIKTDEEVTIKKSNIDIKSPKSNTIESEQPKSNDTLSDKILKKTSQSSNENIKVKSPVKKIEDSETTKEKVTKIKVQVDTATRKNSIDSIDTEMAKLTDTKSGAGDGSVVVPPSTSTSSSKLLEILETKIEKTKAEKKFIPISIADTKQKFVGLTAAQKKVALVNKMEQPNQASPKIITKSVVLNKDILNSKKSSKPIILSERIIRPANDTKILVKKVAGQHVSEDYEISGDKFVIKKPVSVNSTTNIPKTSRTVATVLSPSMLTSPGNIITTTSSDSSKTVQCNDNMFDINSMPILISDDFLTPESIEKMPIVISNATENEPKTVQIKGKVTLEKQKILNTQRVGVKPAVQQGLVKNTRVVQTTPTKVITNKPAVITSGRQGKFYVVPSTSPSSGSKYTVGKKFVRAIAQPSIVKTPVSTVTSPSNIIDQKTIKTPQKNTFVLLTGKQGNQSRYVLGPAQQKTGTPKLCTKVISGKRTLGISNVITSKSSVPGQTTSSQAIITSKGQILTPISQSQMKALKTSAGTSITTGQTQKIIIPNKTVQNIAGIKTKTVVVKSVPKPMIQKIQSTTSAVVTRQVFVQKQSPMKVTTSPMQTSVTKQKIPVPKPSSLTKTLPSAGRAGNTLGTNRVYVQKRISDLKSTPEIIRPQQKITDSVVKSPSIKQGKLSPAISTSAIPPLVPLSPTLNKTTTETVISQPTVSTAAGSSLTETTSPAPKQLFIQDDMGNQTSVTQGQILAVPGGEIVDGQPQSYMLVTVDESGNLLPLDNQTLMALDPNLIGPDGNLTLQLNQEGSASSTTVTDPVITQADSAELAKTQTIDSSVASPQGFHQLLITDDQQNLISLSGSDQQLLMSDSQNLILADQSVLQDKSIISGSENQVTYSISNAEDGQQILISGDPEKAQHLINALTSGTQDLSQIIGSEGNIIINGQQIILNTDTSNSERLILTTPSDSFNMQETFGADFVGQSASNQDILAAALANTDVFQQENAISEGLNIVTSAAGGPLMATTSELSPSLYPSMQLPNLTSSTVLETSLTNLTPIMSPLEVPTSGTAKKVPIDIETTSQVPKSLELPITITDPNISQTVSSQLANELQNNLGLPITITDPNISNVRVSEVSTPTFSYGLPGIEDTIGTTTTSSSGPISMPLLTEELETETIQEDIIETIVEEKSTSLSDIPIENTKTNTTENKNEKNTEELDSSGNALEVLANVTTASGMIDVSENNPDLENIFADKKDQLPAEVFAQGAYLNQMDAKSNDSDNVPETFVRSRLGVDDHFVLESPQSDLDANSDEISLQPPIVSDEAGHQINDNNPPLRKFSDCNLEDDLSTKITKFDNIS